MVVCVIILLLITAGFPEYDAVYFDSPGPNAAFTVPENSPSYDVATFDLVGTTPSAIIKKQEPTNPEFELVLVRFSYILRAPALDFEAERTYTVTIEASDSDDGSTDTQTHTVTVTDINEKPKFTQTTFHATIESRDLYQVVVDINPTDVDTEPPNSAANCTIEDGNDNGFFQIEYITCLISTDKLLGVGQTFSLIIGLADQGTPPLTADQNAVVTIEVIECPKLNAPENGNVSTTIYNKDIFANFSCEINYTLVGEAILNCTEKGTWSSPSPTCSRECLNLTRPDNAEMTSVSGHEGNVVEFYCNTNYSLVGISNLTCQSNGNWSARPPVCLRGCPVLPDTDTMHVNATSAYEGQSVQYSCVNNYTLVGEATLTCTSAGNWSDTLPQCLRNCQVINKPTNGNVNVTTAYANQIAWFTCDVGYILIGQPAITCLPEGTWDQSLPVCIRGCPTLTIPDNGSSNSSVDMYAGQVAKFSCDTNFTLVGRSLLTCLSNGSWTGHSPVCKRNCPNAIAPNNGSVSPSSGYVGQKVQYRCDKGYYPLSNLSKIVATCLSNASWDRGPPSCHPIDCRAPPIIKENGNHTYNGGTFYQAEVTYRCNPHYLLRGFPKIICLYDGKWSNTEAPTCKKIESNTKLVNCSKDSDFRGNTWAESLPGQVAVKHCDEDYKGQITRNCTQEGTWKLPVYNCTNQAILELANTFDDPKNVTSQDVTNALNTLADVSTTTASNNSTPSSLQSGDLVAITSVLDKIASAGQNVTAVQAESFVNTVGNLLDPVNAHSWQSVSEAEPETDEETGHTKAKGADSVLRAVDSFAGKAAKSILGNSTSKTIESKNVAIVIGKMNSKEEVQFPDRKQNLTGWVKEDKSRLVFPAGALKDNPNRTYSSAFYRNLSGILTSAFNGDSNNNPVLNSPVLSFQVSDNVKTLNVPIEISFAPQDTTLTNPSCTFWDFTRASWNDSGCRLTPDKNKPKLITCKCDHLTNFAILMSPWIENNVDTEAINIISIVGCSVSLLGLIITIGSHVELWRYMRSDRVKILINLCVALLIGYLVFIFGVDKTENKALCTSIAVMLQYIYLVVFFIMLAEGIEIAITVLYVFNTKSRIRWLLPLAWGIPAVIVGSSLGASQLEGYGTNKFCWLSVTNGVIWSFVGPAFIVVLINAVLLVLVMRQMFGTQTLAQRSRLGKTKAGVRSLCVLLPLMGSTWVLGLFYVSENAAWIQYVFAVCNGLQGFFIFLFHCALNTQLHRAWGMRKKRRKSSAFSSSFIKSKKSNLKSSSFSGQALDHSESRDNYRTVLYTHILSTDQSKMVILIKATS